MSAEQAEDVGQRIRRMREAAGLSQEHLAQIAGTNQQTVQRIESGSTSFSKYTQPILQALLHLDLQNASDADPLARTYLDSFNQTKIKQKIRSDKKRSTKSDTQQVDLLFSTELENGCLYLDPKTSVFLDVASRLVGHKDVYAVHIASTDMQPEFEAGDIVIVDPKAPIMNNVTCMLVNDFGGKHEVIVRRLVGVSESDWTVKNWKSSETKDLPRKAWSGCHRIVGRLMRG